MSDARASRDGGRISANSRFRGAIWLALIVASITFPARAALFDDEEARRRVAETNVRLTNVQNQLEARLNAIEGQLKNQGLVDLFNQVEQMKAEFARLRGQIEVLLHEQDQQQKRQRDLYIDLDSRMRRLESGGGVPTAGGAAPATASGAPAASTPPPSVASVAPAASGAVAQDTSSEQRAYDAALDQFKAGNYPAAIASFNSVVKANPTGLLAPSAFYCIGNAQFALRYYRGAIATQRQLVSQFPGNPKVPDALLNIATSQFELNDAAASRRTLEELISKYPQSDAAAKAKQRLAIR
jgi:tol-pal system protein YbgF